MSLNIFCKPRLLINDKEVAFCKTASFSTNVTSLQSFSATITEPDFENYLPSVKFSLSDGIEWETPNDLNDLFMIYENL